MSVHIMFPNFVFTREFLGKDSGIDPTMSADYFDCLKNEIDGMRKRDPVGRRVSNAGSGWQSIDGCDTNPMFVKAIRAIRRTVDDEMMPFLGLKPNTFKTHMHNSWANINDKGAYNRPHLHNGCFYSGVLYIKGDGDEGQIQFIDKDNKIAGVFPHAPKLNESFSMSPKTGDLHLFPSGLMHMVEPNPTDKDRYSISFNLNVESDNNHANFIEDNQNLHFEITSDYKLKI
tara:strand:- start:4686 stop:5375 length:690 start_codon:yes stop_codon:yes gene_type:complete